MTSTTERPSIASFWHDLPREGRLMLSVVAFEFIGTGLVLPFWVVYLHELRGYSLEVVGVLLAAMSAAGVIAAAPAGKLIDKVGPRATMIVVLVSAMVGQTMVAFADNIVTTTIAIAIIGAGFGMGWPTSQALISSVVPSEIRARYFGMNFSLLNLGIGIGGIVGGLVADVHHLGSFQLMYIGDAISYVPSLFLMLFPLRNIGGPVPPPEDGPDEEVTYLQVFRAPAMRTVCALMFVSAFVGYSQLNAGMPAYSRAIGEVSTRGLGFAFAANTLVIVLLQLVVLQRIEGRKRTRVIVVMSAVWAASWLCLAASGISPGTVSATLFVAACASVFALGETLLQPTMPAIVNDLAPDHLRGRYNALTAGVFQTASILGPIVAGFMIGHGLHLEFIAMLVLGCGLTAWLSAVRLEPQLDDVANGLVRAETTPESLPAEAPIQSGVAVDPAPR
ncbi:MFS transporter [Nocardioides marmorisolisilvae]|uniref:MFS transporter n=1 Tax=Nocardioides marmorisolisilvae TaxID=1542737 RepID=A0A3N0DPS8_9ACTN|nr:MFS transporter [Nocardioides marmorisolisilvae]RNL77333.1 MFS transporter [Nocardioides marmorisolisilvae]